MAALTWDTSGTRFYESGVDHGVLYTEKAASGNDPADPYGTATAWNGLTAVTESPSGADVTDMWADNIKYASLRAAEKFGATVEAYTYPPEFAECDGSKAVTDGVAIGQQPRKKFGFSYRTNKGNDLDQNAGYLLHLVYGCSVSPSQRSYATINDSPDAITFSWELDSTPVEVSITGQTGLKPTSIVTIDSTQTTSGKMKAIEDILYGTSNANGRMPLPGEVVSIIDAAT